MKHIHAELMALYAQDAMETETPWERWEYFDNQVWRPLRTVYPLWFTNTQYRRKPQTININGHEVPEPYRGEMVEGQHYYRTTLTTLTSCWKEVWLNNEFDHHHMKYGLLHLTEEAAIKHAEALLSITK